jgi:hypothetical protein
VAGRSVGVVVGSAEDAVAFALGAARPVGCAVGVRRDCKTTVAVEGLLNARTGVRPSPDSVWQIGSVTKLLTAAVVLVLVERGRVTLDGGRLQRTLDTLRASTLRLGARSGELGLYQPVASAATAVTACAPRGLCSRPRCRSAVAGSVRSTGSTAAGSHPCGRARAAATATMRCSATVHGVTPGPGSLTAQWVRAGFDLTSGTTSDPISGLTYSTTGSDPPRIELDLSISTSPSAPDPLPPRPAGAPPPQPGDSGVICGPFPTGVNQLADLAPLTSISSISSM